MAVKIYHKEIRTILLGNTEINYELARKSVKNINLRMNATGQIKVSASQNNTLFLQQFNRRRYNVCKNKSRANEHLWMENRFYYWGDNL